MCFGGDDGSDEAKKARQAEEARQARIRQGTARINSIFDGSTVGDGAIAAGATFDPNGTYYNADGTRWTPTANPAASNPFVRGTSGAGAGRSDRISGRDNRPGARLADAIGRGSTPAGETPEQQFAKMLAGGKLFSGTKNTGGFNDDFFSGRRQAYLDYATPQLEDQYGNAQRQLIFSLDRSGNLDSTARAEKMGELQKLYDIQEQQVADRALTSETQARNAVEDARANLITTLNATGDAEGAATAALARSQALSAPQEYSPLGQLFVDFTNGLGVQAAQERSFAAGGPSPRYNTGLFGNAGRVSVS